MARDRAIVDVVTRITPSVEQKPTQEAAEANRDGFLVEFRGGETARVMPGPLAAAYLDLLEDLRRQGNPVYVTVAADGGAVTDLMIPRVMKLVDLRQTGRGEVEVEFFPSHARHTLKRDSEAFKALLDALSSGDRDDGWLVVTETDRHEIIDVRPFRGDGGPPLPRPPGRLAALTALVVHTWLFQVARWWTYKLCAWFCCPPRFTCCVSLGTAWRMFDMCAARSCVPIDPQPPCIPFLYPDDGCWARAHEMCRLMIASGVKPAKVWIDGSLMAATKNACGPSGARSGPT